MKLICVSYQRSHLIPILEFIKKNRDEEILFYGDKCLKKTVEAEGYEYIEYCEKEILKLPEYRKKVQIIKTKETYKKLHTHLRKILLKYSITEVYCDISRYMFYAPVANELSIPVIIYWTYNGPTHFNIHAPAPTCPIRSNNSKLEKLFNIYSWCKQFYDGEIRTKKILFYFFYPYNTILKINNLRRLRYSIDGWFLDGHKLVCGPKELNPYYDRNTKHTGIHMNNTGRLVNVSCASFNIYITWGTNSERYKEKGKIQSYIIKEILPILESYNIHIYINNKETNIKKRFSDNISCVTNINQSDLISKVDLVIFHGGFGTFKECYYYKKQMIIIPFMYDQYSSAALCERIGLGKWINPSEIVIFNLQDYLMKLIEKTFYEEKNHDHID